jgi:hypothetical protein
MTAQREQPPILVYLESDWYCAACKRRMARYPRADAKDKRLMIYCDNGACEQNAIVALAPEVMYGLPLARAYAPPPINSGRKPKARSAGE